MSNKTLSQFFAEFFFRLQTCEYEGERGGPLSGCNIRSSAFVTPLVLGPALTELAVIMATENLISLIVALNATIATATTLI